MTTYVQITGCFETDDREVVPFASHEDADFYAVYVGAPGEYRWQADFLRYEDAMTYTLAIHKHHGFVIDDKTFSEGKANDQLH